MTEEWVQCPGSTGIGADVVWGTDYHPIPADAVAAAQQRCREFLAQHRARQGRA